MPLSPLLPQRRMTPAGRVAVDFGPVQVFLGAQDGKYPDCNQLVITGSDSRMAIDSSITSHLIGPAFDTADLMVLSHGHEDHMAGLYRLPDVPVQAPAADLAAVQSWAGVVAACGFAPEIQPAMLAMFREDFAYHPRPDATGYDDGQVWDLGGVTVRAVHTPGHTPGHSALLLEREGVAFIADIDLSSFGPYYGDANSSLSAFRHSIEVVRALPAQVWVVGHHKGIYTDRVRFLQDLDAYAAKITARDARLLQRLARSPATLADLVAHRLLYPVGFDAIWLPAVEERAIQRHLSQLVQHGRVRHFTDTGHYELA